MATSELSSRLSRRELIAMISMLTATGALAIDMMLPAFPSMRDTFGLSESSTEVALVVTAFFVGLAVGQLLWGPLSDTVGRKRMLWAGLAVYAVGAIGAAFSPSLTALLVWRVVGGLGAASLRAVAQAVVRDLYRGEAMASVLSYVMAVFIAIPIIAPSLGAAVLALWPWQAVFGVLAAFAAVMAVWLVRMPETLSVAARRPYRAAELAQAARTIATNRLTVGLTLAQVAAFGFFTSYLASSQAIVSDVLGLEEWFPVIFGGSAAVLGLGVLANTRLLRHFGLRRVLLGALRGYLAATSVLLVVALLTGGTPSLAVYAVGVLPVLFVYSTLIPNLNSAAMIPMGAIAGTASAVIGCAALLGGAVIGALVDRTFDGSITPFAVAGVLSAVGALLAHRWADAAWHVSVRD
jgi:DHA1 family bicyclomycin/chloramphenicol resistance-like MFS transporter